MKIDGLHALIIQFGEQRCVEHFLQYRPRSPVQPRGPVALWRHISPCRNLGPLQYRIGKPALHCGSENVLVVEPRKGRQRPKKSNDPLVRERVDRGRWSKFHWPAKDVHAQRVPCGDEPMRCRAQWVLNLRSTVPESLPPCPELQSLLKTRVDPRG